MAELDDAQSNRYLMPISEIRRISDDIDRIMCRRGFGFSRIIGRWRIWFRFGFELKEWPKPKQGEAETDGSVSQEAS